MNYVSTRGQAPALSFEDTMLTGLAPDGGLYVPETVPVFDANRIAGMHGDTYEETAFKVIRPFTGETFTDDELTGLIDAAYRGFGHTARAPLKQMAGGLWLCELFHGPTIAFKDFAMQLIGQMFQHVLARRGERITIVGATSGDTGSAAIEAFKGLDNVDVVILFPHGRVSEVQRRQMTTPDEANVHALAVDGTFDDCQAALKAMFADTEFRDEVRLAAVNSINWARVLAQVVYYFTSAVSVGAPHRPVSFTVPTGNFGDIYAGHIARRMGLPVDRLVVATNRNDILARAINSGEYRTGEVHPTISPSMDIQVSSNFERLLFDSYDRDGNAITQLMDEMKTRGGFAISQGARERIAEHFLARAVSEEETLDRIKRTLEATGELVCPHTAVGLDVAAEHANTDTPMISLATAHPAKFPDAVKAATGIHPPLPKHMSDLYDRSERVTNVSNDLDALKAVIREKRAK